MRDIALEVHIDFCEVAIPEGGEVRSAGRIKATPEELELFAQSLGADDRVALEVTGNAWAIKRIVEPHVAEVIVVSPNDTGIRGARAKTDRLDARTLARLLAAGELDGVWMPDRRTQRMRRRLGRRTQLVRARARAKNEIHATLIRCLIGRAPHSDLFGKRGRQWLRELDLPCEERESVDAAVRQIEFLDREIEAVERLVAAEALESPEIKRLMTVAEVPPPARTHPTGLTHPRKTPMAMRPRHSSRIREELAGLQRSQNGWIASATSWWEKRTIDTPPTSLAGFPRGGSRRVAREAPRVDRVG